MEIIMNTITLSQPRIKTKVKEDTQYYQRQPKISMEKSRTLEPEALQHLSDKAIRDYKLVRKAIEEGDQKSFAEMMALYKDSIYYMLLKMVNNRDDADDLTIEAFGKAFKNIRQYTPDYAFSTWLFKIATNNCIDFIRKKRKMLMAFDNTMVNDEGETITLDVKSDGIGPEEVLIKKQKKGDLRDIIEKLKPRYRTLIEMRYYQELSYEEIALEMSLPLGTVKAQLYRAREFLYQVMKNTEYISH